jgi:hypothetical protein
MLAIYESFREWRHYLEAPQSTVRVITDHEAPTKFMDTKALSRKRQTRWAEYLAAFNFRIEWRTGKRNPADSLSRRPDFERDSTEKGADRSNLLQDLVTIGSQSPHDSSGAQDPQVGISLFRVVMLTRAQNHSIEAATQWYTATGVSSALTPAAVGQDNSDQPLLTPARGAVPPGVDTRIAQVKQRQEHEDVRAGAQMGSVPRPPHHQDEALEWALDG